MKYIEQRYTIKDNENKRYVNFAEGGADTRELKELERLADQWGLAPFFVITPAPFFRATHGSQITLMPLCETSTYAKFIDLLPEAERIARERGDPDFDLEGERSPPTATILCVKWPTTWRVRLCT